MLLLSAAPRAAQASLDFTSSMTARCLASDCSQIEFVLDVSGDIYVDLVRIASTNPSLWTFASLVGVKDRNGNPLGWVAFYENGGLLLRVSGTSGGEPLFITVNMGTSSDPSHLFDGSLTYSGQGGTTPNYGLGEIVSFEGTVTPEPLSAVLFGTGLAGVAGFALRRRRPPA